MAFSTKVTAGSSASPTPSAPWATGSSPSGPSRSVSSAILPLLLLAMTSFCDIGSVVKQRVGKPHRQVLLVAGGAGGNVEGHQVAGPVLVLGDEVHRIAFLNAPEGQEVYLLDVVSYLAFNLTAHRAGLAMFVLGHDGNVDDANALTTLQVIGLGHFRVEEGAREYAPVYLVLTKVFFARLHLSGKQHGDSQEHQFR